MLNLMAQNNQLFSIQLLIVVEEQEFADVPACSKTNSD